ncbi:hypothetical protein Nepgr_001368 [Nepenthes gracilis]|uniref:Uncharacterized protein n=1 Tax=Nepenthes gracilis TaxID=150966 RepID=A0AAD3P846_NEPGR|nr:hypothetical protein Nepgr_001368 [Nepenthes gracilis]
MFNIHGKTNHHFTLVSDANLQIIARLIGHRPHSRLRDNTWIKALGLLFGSHTFNLSAKCAVQWTDKLDHLLDGAPINVPGGHLSAWSPADVDFLVERMQSCNSVVITIYGVVQLSTDVEQVAKEDDRTHRYQIPSDYCFAHLEVQF